MKIYIASSLKNHNYNNEVNNALTESGFVCFLPQNHTINTKDGINNTSTKVYENNLIALNEADLVLVIAHSIGTDTAWECGYALGQNKSVILVELIHESIEEMYMVYESIPQNRRFKIKDFSGYSLSKIITFINSQN